MPRYPFYEMQKNAKDMSRRTTILGRCKKHSPGLAHTFPRIQSSLQKGWATLDSGRLAHMSYKSPIIDHMCHLEQPNSMTNVPIMNIQTKAAHDGDTPLGDHR